MGLAEIKKIDQLHFGFFHFEISPVHFNDYSADFLQFIFDKAPPFANRSNEDGHSQTYEDVIFEKLLPQHQGVTILKVKGILSLSHLKKVIEGSHLAHLTHLYLRDLEILQPDGQLYRVQSLASLSDLLPSPNAVPLQEITSQKNNSLIEKPPLKEFKIRAGLTVTFSED